MVLITVSIFVFGTRNRDVVIQFYILLSQSAILIQFWFGLRCECCFEDWYRLQIHQIS